MIIIDSITLKKYIHDNDKIAFVLESIGCKNIKYHSFKGYFTCANYNGDNPTAINVFKNDYINVKNWTREKDFNEKSDIISLVQYNRKCDFRAALKYLHDILGLEMGYFSKKISKQKKDPLLLFERIRDKTNIENRSIDFQYLDENILNGYVPMLHIDWFNEGITYPTANKFGLLYSYRQNRMIIPLREWSTGKLLGTNSRTMAKHWKEFGIKKYYITPSYPKSYNLFGLYEHYDEIKKLGYVIVYESEKSVLKRDSLLDYSGVALSGHTMSDEQVRILIGLNVDIIIALDTDIPLQVVRDMCENFYGIRNVFYTVDKYNLLKEKECIADKSNKIFNYCFKYKVKYDKTEHQEYLKGLKS